MSISPAVGGAQPLPCAPAQRQVLRGRQARRQAGAEELPAGVRAGAQVRGARQGHGRARHAVRGARLQLHRPDRRPRPRIADPDAAEHQGADGPAVPARRDQEGAGLQARRGRPGPVPRARQVRPERRHQEGGRGQADLHAGLRRLAVRHGGRRQAPDRHHAGDARRLRAGALRAGVSEALLRRRHRRAARGDVRRRPRVRRHEAGRRDLLDVPAARLRPADPRRRAAEPAGRVRARPRRPRRGRRRDAPRRVRPVVPALHPEHDRDGAVRRERVPPDAVHRLPAGRAERRPVSARSRAGGRDRPGR